MLAVIIGLVAGQIASAAPAGARAVLDEAAARAFVRRQEAAWNARDAAAYFALFAPTATFVDQAQTSKGGVIRYGSSTMAEARRQVQRYFARSRSVDRTVIESVVLAPDRRSARIRGQKITTVEAAGQGRRQCAQTEQTLSVISGRLLSLGQIDTAIRCRDARL